VDAATAQAARGVAPANAEAASVRGEAVAGVPGTPGAAEPAARAESAQPELGGFRAPAQGTVSAEDAPTVGSIASRFGWKGDPGISLEGQGTSVPAVIYRDADGIARGGLNLVHDADGNLTHVTVAVDPAFQRQGIATAMYDAAKKAGYDVEAVSGASGYTEAGAGLANARRGVSPTGARPETSTPRRLEDVQSNPHLLREPGPGETPMTMDERLAHQDTLEQRYQANTERLAAIDEQLRNPTARPERPPWAAGFTNDQVATMAAKVGRSPYEPLWWEKAGLEAGSGEVREMVNEGGVERGRFDATRTSTPAELRAEQRALQQDQLHLEAAGEQQATAPDNARFVRPPERAAGALPFGEGGASDPGAQLAQEVVTRRGTVTSDPNQVTATRGDVTGRGIVNPAEVVTEAPSEATRALMPNLNAIGKDMPEVVAQIQKSVDDNPALWEHYKQGTITFDSLKNDLAARVGMTKEDWLKTKVGQAFNDQEMVALQAAMIEEQARQTDMAKSILSKGGVDNLTPEELAYSITQLTQAQSLAAVAKGAGSTVARSLNARKISFTRQLASDITAQNERRAAQRVKAQAARVATRAGDLLDNAKTLDQQKAAATAAASRPARPGAPRTPQNIIDQIANAYDELDRYNAMSLHEKADVFDKLKAQREAAAAARASAVRGAPEELLSALKQELKAEQDNFAKRKNTWETMAFIDSKAAENAARERAAFRGGLYIEQQRRVAQNALKGADTEINRAFDSELKRRGQQSAKAQKLLESLGGTEVTKDVLKNYLAALSDPDPMVAAKFLQSTASMSNWKRATVVRLAGLVSSPITQMVNIGGNVAGAMIEVPTRGLVVGIDALRAAATGGERQAYAGEILPMLKAYGPGFLGQWDNAYRVLKTGFTPEQLADPTRIRGAFSRSELLNAGVEAPLRLLGAADQLFRGGAMAAHSMRVATRQAIREGFSGPQVAGRAASIVKNLEDYPELAKEAADATARQVYQERRAGLGGGNKPLPDVAEFGVKQVLPFYQTPMNITAQGAALSPFGFTGALQSSLKARGMAVGSAAERTVQGRETLLAEERAARAIIGSAILGGGIALGSAGMLTGSYPIDPKEASTLPQGWRPWSLRITSPIDNNTYYLPMQNFNAAGFPLAMASILTDPQHRGKTLADPDEQLNAVTAIGRYVLDNTFLQGLSDVVNTLHDPKSAAQKFGEGLAASYGPYSSLGREMQRIQGVATRNPHNGFVGLWEALESNYPGASANVPEATTPLGEPRTQGATGIARVVPYRYDIERDTPLLQQLRESGVGIPTEHKSLNYGGQHIDLTEDEQDVLKRQRGEALKQYLDPYVNDPKFQNLSQAERNRYLTVLVSHAVQYADHQFLNDMPGADLSSRLKPKTVPDPYYLGDAGAAA
jgi:GNAT superfamily N-acetyltransferase